MGRIRKRHTGRMPSAMWIAVTSAAVLSIIMLVGATSRTSYEIEPHFNTLFVIVANVAIFLLLYPLNFWLLSRPLGGARRVTLSLVASLLLALVFTVVSFQLERATDPAGSTSNPFVLNLIANLAAGLISFLVSFLISNLTEQQRIVLENERLKSENLLVRYQTLQKQVSPHFLFNSLNTLDGLIASDSAAAHAYVHRLAATFRYSTRNETEVTLREELEFTRSYVYMMQIRHGENLHIKQSIDLGLLEHRLPPISLQMLVENAIKHNVISTRHPLTVDIETTKEGTIRVSNRMQPKADHEASSGTGLANLAERYRLLYQKEIAIQSEGGMFTVEIPLVL